MNTGEILGIVLLLMLVVWGGVDLWLWKTNRQTFSQWVIKESKKRLSFTLVAIGLIIGTAITLILHFELIQILIGHL